jgi:hypothetical protein
MSQFLFLVEMPPTAALSTVRGYPEEWTMFEGEANTTLEPVRSCTRLQRNAWLLPAENTLPVLKALSDSADRCNLSYSCVLIPAGAEIIALDVKPSPR